MYGEKGNDMTQTMTEAERVAMLTGLGLDPSAATTAPASEPTVDITIKAKPKKAKKAKAPKVMDDPRTIDPSKIVFDPALLDEFVLDRTDIALASRKVFDLYKSSTKNPERNKLLHRLISEFIARTKTARNPRPSDGYVTGKAKASKEQHRLAQVLADHGIDSDGLATLLAALKEKA